MAKKMTAKERREVMKAQSPQEQRKQKAQQEVIERAEKEKREKEEAKLRAEEEAVKRTIAEMPHKGDRAKKKTAVKAAGLKSTFRIKDTVVMTSFGRGNTAVVEKVIAQDVVQDINREKPAFDVRIPDDVPKYLVDSRRIKKVGENSPAITDKPSAVARMDAVRLKPLLERQYFGKEFPEDNIHIQLAYNVLDIVKILTVHSNNIVYELNNLLRDEKSDEFDLIGYLSTRNRYEDWKANPDPNVEPQRQQFDRLIHQDQLAYFGKAFYKPAAQMPTKPEESGQQNQAGKQKYVRRGEEEIYSILALVGTLRQVCTHAFAYSVKVNGAGRVPDVDWLFCLDEETSMTPQVRRVMNDIYEDATRSVNRDFIKNNRLTNFAILKKMYPQEDPATYLPQFYDFTIRKSYKNLGFSIRKLREAILASDDSLVAEIKNKKYDTMRSKLYQLFDFALFRHYEKHKDQVESMVDALRAARTEDENLRIYCLEARKTWNTVKKTVEIAVEHMNATVLKTLRQESKNADASDYEQYFPVQERICEETPSFCKLMYLVTMLLDGKEINDLLTTLIHNLEKIASFYDTMRELNMDCEFVPAYKMLEDSQEIADGLRLINSFCRMQKPLPSAKKVMYREAVQILGMKDVIGDAELDRLMDKILCVETENGISRKVDGEKGFRNFLANNVIESSRFQYLIRYSNPEKVRQLASNRALVIFQLKRLPETQIDRYYKLCVSESEISIDKKVEALADIIVNMDYSKFKGVNQKAKAGTPEEAEKNCLRNIISLYLTMLYLVVKNLVYVNSRYVMAFEAVVRDSALHGLNMDEQGQPINEDKGYDYTKLTRKCLEEHWLKKHPAQCLEENIKNLNGNEKLIRFFRNKVAHLNVVQCAYKYVPDMARVDSYYGIYHYVLQRILLQDQTFEFTEVGQRWKSAVDNYHSYNKDMVKALCVPFGYNLPRYKNLTICDLFDKNETPQKSNTEKIGKQ